MLLQPPSTRILLLLLDIYSYDCIVIDGCGSSFTSSPKVITIVNEPSVDISGSTGVCQNGSVILTANTTNGTGTYLYEWRSAPSATGPWTAIPGAINQTYSPPTNIAGTYYFQVHIYPAHPECNEATSPAFTFIVDANMTAGTPSSSPTLCVNTPLTNITIATTGATGIGAATGLPGGVNAVWASNVITISGTPSAAGTFNYSIPLTGGCGTVNATGTITVTANMTAGTPSSSPTLCVNTPLTNITIATTAATGIGAATGLPGGVNAVWASNVITISGTPSAAGTFNYSIPLTGGCGTVNATGTITVLQI